MQPSVPKKDPRILRSKAALRQALLQLMETKSFSAITITDIITTAKYNRSTFYANYANKEELLDDLISELIKDLLQSFRAPYKQSREFVPHELHANSIVIFSHIAENSSFYTTLANSDALPKLKEKMFVSLKQIIMKELVYETPEIDQELLVIYSLHALLGLIFHWIESGYNHSPAYMQEQLLKILFHRPPSAKMVISPKT